MSDAEPGRDAAVARSAEVMRELMARAVLFQEAVARSGGLNGTDLQTVGLLMSEGPATPGELAQRVGVTSGGAITAVVDRLERAGYVTRSRDAHDRRRVIITARTDTVRERVGPVYARVGARWTEYLGTLTVEQVELANEVMAMAAEINRTEIEHLRRERAARR